MNDCYEGCVPLVITFSIYVDFLNDSVDLPKSRKN